MAQGACSCASHDCQVREFYKSRPVQQIVAFLILINFLFNVLEKEVDSPMRGYPTADAYPCKPKQSDASAGGSLEGANQKSECSEIWKNGEDIFNYIFRALHASVAATATDASAITPT